MQRESDLPTALHESVLTIWGVPIRCIVLSNGQRVLNADDVDLLFSVPKTADLDPREAEKLVRFLRNIAEPEGNMRDE